MLRLLCLVTLIQTCFSVISDLCLAVAGIMPFTTAMEQLKDDLWVLLWMVWANGF